MVEGAAIGLLAMGFYEERRFSAADRVFVETFARNAAQALRRAQRLETEARLRHSLETTLRSIGDAVIATDPSGAITFLNPVAERLTGWTQDEALGRPVHEVFRIVNEETRAPVESPVERVLREGAVVGLANHTVLVAKDGRETPIDDSGAPIRDASDSMMGVVLVFRDVTAKKLDERRRAFLSDAVTTLASSLDYQATLAARRLPRRAHGRRLVRGRRRRAGGVRPAARRDRPRRSVESEPGARSSTIDTRPTRTRPTGVFNVLRTGASELYAEIPETPPRSPRRATTSTFACSATFGLRSAMVVPLTARGQTLGAITFVYAESGRTYHTRETCASPRTSRAARRSRSTTRACTQRSSRRVKPPTPPIA